MDLTIKNATVEEIHSLLGRDAVVESRVQAAVAVSHLRAFTGVNTALPLDPGAMQESINGTLLAPPPFRSPVHSVSVRDLSEQYGYPPAPALGASPLRSLPPARPSIDLSGYPDPYYAEASLPEHYPTPARRVEVECPPPPSIARTRAVSSPAPPVPPTALESETVLQDSEDSIPSSSPVGRILLMMAICALATILGVVGAKGVHHFKGGDKPVPAQSAPPAESPSPAGGGGGQQVPVG